MGCWLSLQKETTSANIVSLYKNITAAEAIPPTVQTMPTTPDSNRGYKKDDAHENIRRLYSTLTPVPQHLPKVCRVYFAPILDETAVSTANFFFAVKADIC
jgi:hypothetical protein